MKTLSTQNRLTVSEECLARNQRNPRDFLMRFITVDEPWIHHYIPKAKEQSNHQRIFLGESASKKAIKTVPSDGKVMTIVFWDSQSDYLQKRRTITQQYYSILLARFHRVKTEKRPRLQRKNHLNRSTTIFTCTENSLKGSITASDTSTVPVQFESDWQVLNCLKQNSIAPI